MRILIDTNILISAALNSHGAAFDDFNKEWQGMTIWKN